MDYPMPKGAMMGPSSDSSMTKNDDYEKREAQIAAMKASELKAKTPRPNGPPMSKVIC